jgi:hypothetical protein
MGPSVIRLRRLFNWLWVNCKKSSFDTMGRPSFDISGDVSGYEKTRMQGWVLVWRRVKTSSASAMVVTGVLYRY